MSSSSTSGLQQRETIRILHVDDDPDITDLTETFLVGKDERFEVETAHTVSEGLHRLESREFDCIISDYEMPGPNGIEFLETVREDHPDLPFVLFTGKGSEEVASAAISAGVSDYLQKDPSLDQYDLLANRIKNLVAKYAAEELVERSYLAMDRSREGIALLDHTGEFIYANETYADLVGYTPEELVGEQWELVSPDDRAHHIDEEIPEDGYRGGETVYRRNDGGRVRVDQALVYSEDGTIICLATDVAESSTAQRLAREERLAFERFLDSVQEYALFTVDSGGYVTTWNGGAEELLGYTEREVLGTHLTTVYREEERDRGLPDGIVETALEEGSASHQGPIVRDDGSTFQADVTLSALDVEDAAPRIAVVIREIDDRTQREEMEFFNSILRHDVLNGMTIIKMRAELLADELEGEQAQYAETIVDWCNATTEVTKRVRRVVETLAAPQETHSLESVDAAAIIERKCGELSKAYPQVTFESSLPETLRVEADELFSDVLANVLTNSIEHNDTADLRIETTAEVTDETVRIRIADNGVGIQDDRKVSVFRRGETSYVKETGSGFGLFFVHVMVNKYDGEIWVEDSEAGGAAFVIELARAGEDR